VTFILNAERALVPRGYVIQAYEEMPLLPVMDVRERSYASGRDEAYALFEALERQRNALLVEGENSVFLGDREAWIGLMEQIEAYALAFPRIAARAERGEIPWSRVVDSVRGVLEVAGGASPREENAALLAASADDLIDTIKKAKDDVLDVGGKWIPWVVGGAVALVVGLAVIAVAR